MKKKFDKYIVISLAWVFILFFIGFEGYNLYSHNNIIELVVYMGLFIILILYSTFFKNSKSIVIITIIFIVALLFRVKGNSVALLLYIFQVYFFLHFSQKILEKKEKCKCICYEKIRYGIEPAIINFLRFILIWGICKIFSEDELFSSKNNDLYSFAIVFMDSIFLGFYEFYNKKENIESKISFIKVCRCYNWGFFIIYSTFIFVTYPTSLSITSILFVGFIYLVLRICIFFSLINK